MKHVFWWLALWLALFWLWLLLAGDWNHIEWIAAASAATVAATVGEVARSRASASARIPLRWLAKGWTAVPMILVDFGILVWALLASAVRREVVRGAFRAHEFPVGGDDPASVGVRVWTSWAATLSPNAYVVELEQERQLVLLHDLVPYRRSEEPA